MLNIEVIKFEAQDVITASGVVPAIPLQPAQKRCICGTTNSHGYNSNTGVHKVYVNAEGDYVVCEAKEHTCGH